MQLIHDGKTKTIYDLGEGKVRIIFKDDAGHTGAIDPGGNEVVGKVEGKGLAALKQSRYFFQPASTKSRRITSPSTWANGAHGTEGDVARPRVHRPVQGVRQLRARRYGRYIRKERPGRPRRITLKDDERRSVDCRPGDRGPRHSFLEQVQEAKALVPAAETIRADLAAKGLDLLDIKFECGYRRKARYHRRRFHRQHAVTKDGRPVDPARCFSISKRRCRAALDALATVGRLIAQDM